jgi:S-methylmethionine-dependent homocysteine/selenocysteine methylase
MISILHTALHTALAARGCLLLDGPTGTELIRRGYAAHPLLWTAEAALAQPELLSRIHRDYVDAGADILTANTFRTSAYAAQRAGRSAEQAERWTRAAVAVCQDALSGALDERWVAGSMAPLEDCYHPERVPDDAVLVRAHRQTAAWLRAAGCPLILVETMGTEREAVAAVGAARDAAAPAILASFLPDDSGARLLGGEPLLPAARAVLAAGAHAVLINCVHAEVVERALIHLQPLRAADQGLLLGAYANGSRMRQVDGEPVWEEDQRPVGTQAAEYAQRALGWATELGARILGSCCGTGPEHIRCLHAALRGAGARLPRN